MFSKKKETHLKAITITLMKRGPYFCLYTLLHCGRARFGDVIKYRVAI